MKDEKQDKRKLCIAATVSKNAGISAEFNALDTKRDKPVSIKDEIMERNINSRNDGQHQYKLSGRILVAEDNPSNQMLVKILLEKMGMEAALVADGLEAVELVCSEKFDMILMDMQMPKMNGYEATRLLRERGFDIPIIALTANAMKGDEQKCLDAGCDGYLAKPLRKELFLEMLTKHLSKGKESTSNADTQSSEDTDQVCEKEADVSLKDSAAMQSDLSGDTLLQPVIDVFMEELPELVTQISDACREMNFEILKGLAHQLKGASGSAGFTVLSKYARNVEIMVANEDIENTKKAIDELGEFCRKVVKTQNS